MQTEPQEFIPLSVPNMSDTELRLVREAVETEWVSTAGPFVKQFENDIAAYVGANGAVACQSGTAGIHVALRLAGVVENDEVIVPALTFIATVNPVRYLGAHPVFMDCGDSLCIDTTKLEEFFSKECELRADGLFDVGTGRRISALVVVHVFGNMADMPRIMELCDAYGVPVIEDAAEALGTRYNDGPLAGSFAGTIADYGVFSFNGNKIITTGGGGAILSRDPANLEHAKHLTTQAKSNTLYYEHDEVGYNYRMTNLQAALGVAQIQRLESFIEVKSRNYFRYVDSLSGKHGLRVLDFRKGVRSNMWFYSLLVKDEGTRDTLISKLLERKIQTRPIWGLINEQVPYRSCRAYKIDRAKWYRDRVVNLPCSTNLDESAVDLVTDAILQIVSQLDV